MFEELNAAYFGGKLPRYTVGFSRRLPGGRHTMGRCDDEHKEIMISEDLAPSWKVVRETLLHEMCHIGCPSHGRRFQERLKALADRGETWALEDLRDYTEMTWPKIQALTKTALADAAMDLSRRGGTVPTRLTEGIANQLGYSLVELRRSMPWVDASWRIARREAISVRRNSRTTPRGPWMEVCRSRRATRARI